MSRDLNVVSVQKQVEMTFTHLQIRKNSRSLKGSQGGEGGRGEGGREEGE